MLRLSTKSIWLITVITLVTVNLSCYKSTINTIPERHKDKEQSYRWILANENQIDTNTIILEHQHNWFESTILTRSGYEVQGFIVQTIHKYKTKTYNPPKFTTQFTVFDLPNSTVDKLMSIFHDVGKHPSNPIISSLLSYPGGMGFGPRPGQ